MSLQPLHWYPKPFGAGDIDGEGSKKLLGGPNLDWRTVLVRETAQNSWDARLSGRIPQYTLNERTLSGDQLRILREVVFTKSSDSLGLAQALRRDSVDVIEIGDRNTRGLGGPTRTDFDVREGPTDFRDFVLALGAPRDNDLGGGTYGFGKTASYAASTVGTIVVWTCTLDESGVPEHRFIGSAIGPHFVSQDGRRFTGRQWWGAAPEDGSTFTVHPVVGATAQHLGEQIFDGHFAPGETGTSILIVAPLPTHPEMPHLADVILDNLWPKLIPQQVESRRMDIRAEQFGRPVALPMEGQVMGRLASCLQAVRNAQEGTAEEPSVRLEEIWIQRPKKLLGHLALAKVAAPEAERHRITNSVCLMRNRAELVVKNAMPSDDSTNERVRWVGVFKPAPEVDDVFAAAEPPAHDEWNPEGMTDKQDKSYVRVALRELLTKRQEFLNPSPRDGVKAESSPTARLSRQLGGLLSSGRGPGASEPDERPRSSTRTLGARPGVETIDSVLVPSAGSLAEAHIRLKVSGPHSAPLLLRTSHLAIAVDGGSLSDESIRLDRWLSSDGSMSLAEELHVVAGDEVTAVLRFPSDLAIEYRFEVTAA